MWLDNTHWMTATGMVQTDEDQSMRDVAAMIKKTNALDEGILSALKVGKESVDHIRVEWYEDHIGPLQLTASYDHSALQLTITAPTTTAEIQRICRRNAVLVAQGKNFAVKFTNDPQIGVNTVTELGAGGADVSSTTFYVITQPYSDLLPYSKDRSSGRTHRENCTEILEVGLQETETRKHIPMYGVKDEHSYQLEKYTKLMQQEIKTMFLYGFANISGSAFVLYPDESRTTAGWMHYVLDYDMDGTYESDAMFYSAGGVDLDEGIMNDAFWAIKTAGGLDAGSDVRICVGLQQRAISKMERNIRQTDPNYKRVGYYKNEFITDWGYVAPIMLDMDIHDDKVHLIDFSRVDVPPLSGDSFRLSKRPTEGRHEAWQYHGQYSARIYNAARAHYLIYGLNTTI